MAEPADQLPPSRVPDASDSRASARASRSRRFVMTDSEEHRVTEKIEAFLDGPVARPIVRSRQAEAIAPIGPIRAGTLDTRADWNEAFRREAARHDRYGRPVAVAVIDLRLLGEAGRDPSRVSVDGQARLLGRVLRAAMRETDRIARVGPTRFHLLLPETTRAEARRFTERARRLGESQLVRGAPAFRVAVAVAVAGRDHSLHDALAAAEAELAD